VAADTAVQVLFRKPNWLITFLQVIASETFCFESSKIESLGRIRPRNITNYTNQSVRALRIRASPAAERAMIIHEPGAPPPLPLLVPLEELLLDELLEEELEEGELPEEELELEDDELLLLDELDEELLELEEELDELETAESWTTALLLVTDPAEFETITR